MFKTHEEVFYESDTMERPKSLHLKNPFIDKQIVSPTDLECLAKNIFWEARGESFDEKIRIANVTHNRVHTKGFPKTYCAVVKYPNAFSWVKQGKDFKKVVNSDPSEMRAWKDSYLIAYNQLIGNLEDTTDGAVFFHATYVKKPKDFGNSVLTVSSDAHIYYKLNKDS